MKRCLGIRVVTALYMAATSITALGQLTPPSGGEASQPMLLDYEVSARANFTKAAFRFCSPAYDTPICGIIVLVPGFNGEGRKKLNDTSWQ